jgi:hypothetical protein
VHAADRKPAGVGGEEEQQQPGQQFRHRERERHAQTHRTVEGAAPRCRRPDAERDRQPPGDHGRRRGQHQRVAECLAQHHEHRLVARQRFPEIEVKREISEVEQVLPVPRLVQTEAMPHRFQRGCVDARVLTHERDEVARRQLHQQKRQRRNAEQYRDALKQPADQK